MTFSLRPLIDGEKAIELWQFDGIPIRISGRSA
jgi:hypothetical protein